MLQLVFRITDGSFTIKSILILPVGGLERGCEEVRTGGNKNSCKRPE